MEDLFYDFPAAVTVGKQSDLEYPRSHEILDAIQGNRDYTLVSLAKLKLTEELLYEVVTVDVECHRVPDVNPSGIKFRERLALMVPKDASELVEVLAIRKTFPLMIHQNDGAEGTAASLCLDTESTASVLRTWTAQKFLRKIQWWIESAARGVLHAPDQPVEQLFFVSKYELVLPWNFEAPKAGENRALRFTRTPARPDGSFTLFLEQQNQARVETKGAFYEFSMPPAVHGHIERAPTTLGGLISYLEHRGADLKSKLIAELRARITDKGLVKSEAQWTIVLLHIPIVREQGGTPERTHHRAFISLTNELELGEKIGAYVNHDGTYYSSEILLEPVARDDWKSLPFDSLEVLHTNSAAASRLQSGIVSAGPTAVLIGAGSLGSGLLNFWGRSGWGEWTVVDSDHIKPHNLSRHIAFPDAIGFPKAIVATEMHNLASLGATTAKALVVDALTLSDDAVGKPLRDAEIVVDASTTLEYPRLASSIEGLGRHISVFFTPNGNSSVLLAEDRQRSLRLRSLEAQYYRAVIQNGWGAAHLDGLSKFRSGASCRDISVVMPYTKVMAHTGTLAEQIQLARTVDDALIRAWVRDPATGAVSFFDVPTYPETSRDYGDLKVYFDTGLEKRLHDLRNAALPNETGGVLVGYFDLPLRMLCIVDCLDAPPDSKATQGEFQRGVEGLVEQIKEISRRTLGIVGYIGEWHSHPRGHTADASGHDIIQIVHLAQTMAVDGLPALQLIVGDDDINIIQARAK